MAGPTTDLKKALQAGGFEVYRTLSDRVVLADRVRDNLIMDSGVSAGVTPNLCVHFVVRAQAGDFRGESEQQLFDRARELAGDARGRGYSEKRAERVDIPDPGNPSRTLDTFFEVSYQRQVSDEDELFTELRYALALRKVAGKSGEDR